MQEFRIKKQRSRLTLWLLGFGSLLPLLILSSLGQLPNKPQNNTLDKPMVKAATTTKASEPEPKPLPPPPPPKPKVMGIFTGPQFKGIYDQINYANVKKINLPPPITGNEAADIHIRDLAAARGYVMRSVASAQLNSFGEGDNIVLQTPAIASWQNLKAAAQKDGLGLTLVAGYRAFEDQQALFLKHMAGASITAQQIASGSVDSTVNKILQTVSIPGYSKHHTGYTVDIGCSTGGIFVSTPCFNWLSANNYANAKKFGWIPSYPANTESQGPAPEPWEYVWVGVGALMSNQP